MKPKEIGPDRLLPIGASDVKVLMTRDLDYVAPHVIGVSNHSLSSKQGAPGHPRLESSNSGLVRNTDRLVDQVIRSPNLGLVSIPESTGGQHAPEMCHRATPSVRRVCEASAEGVDHPTSSGEKLHSFR